MSAEYFFAFWNLENLFDVEDSPRRTDKLQRAIGKDVKGWTQALLDRKISQLASIIRQMNGGRGPDLLGMCEIENDYVLKLLRAALTPLGRRYEVVHHDMSDERGIDIGFLYDGDLFTFQALFSHFVMRRTATRDILQVNFTTRQNRLLVVVGNHWPARIPGVLETEGYRQIAGETLAYFHQRILQVHGKDTPVLAMGDFNDEPFNRSLIDYALASRVKEEVIGARTARFLNLMWPLLGQGGGSHSYDNLPNLLDQFLANQNLLKAAARIKVLPETAEVLRFPGMFNPQAKVPAPIRFGGMGKEVNPNGYSDHFPIAVKLVEAN